MRMRRNHIRASVAVAILASCWMGAGEVRADENLGALGVSDSIRWSFLYGGAGVDLTAPNLGYSSQVSETQPYKADGTMFLTQFRFASYFGQTRFGTLMGIDVGVAMGWLAQDSIVKDQAALDAMTWGRFYFDVDMGVALGLLYWGDTGAFAGRLAVAAGAGCNADYGYFYLVPKLALQLLPDTLSLEGEFWWLPLAHSYSGNSVREYRVRGELVYQAFDDMSFGAGLEMRTGDNPMVRARESSSWLDDNPDRIRSVDTLRGHFTMTLGSFSLRWK